jgi:YYY domain-containing protein
MGALVVWWLLLQGMGLLALPLSFRLFSTRADHGYAFAKIIALLCVAYFSWLITHLGLLSLHISLPLSVALFAAANIALGWAARQELRAWLSGPGRRAIVVHDALWTAAFLFFAWQRSLGPEIFGAEKYMDFAFFNTLTRTDVLPPQDPWMAGEIFNYYYFGYLMFADLARMSPLPNHIAYNLCVVTIGGLGFSQMAAIGLMLTRRLPFALLTGAATVLIGNLDGFLQLWEKGSFVPFDYWRSSRIVGSGDTINEFPYFTTIHGDLHPHFIVLPVSILLLALLLDPERRRPSRLLPPSAELWPYLPVTFVLASMVVISPWELPVGAMITFLLLGTHLPLLSWTRLQLGIVVVVMLGIAWVLYAPFYLSFAAPPGGVGFKVASTALDEFLVVFGALLIPALLYVGYRAVGTFSLTAEQGQALIAAAALVTVIAYLAGNAVFVVLLALGATAVAVTYGTADDETRAPLSLVVGACIALLACELVYIKDPYGEALYHMNTVFKLYFQSWILLAAAAPWCFAQMLEHKRTTPGTRTFTTVVVGGLFLASCAYPIGITATRLTYRPIPPTLDGTEYLQREHPDDFAAIAWMRENVKGLPVILEASGNPYSYYARFSSNTGLPTVMGWANHEGLWRNHEKSVQARLADVKRLYSDASLESVHDLLERHRVRYVVVGELERKDHSDAGLAKFTTLNVAFQQGNTIVYER